jgi:tetratricopeptide (TPR) repeat protein
MRRWTAALGILLVSVTGQAASPNRLVTQGNAAWAAERYDEALERYAEASVDAPESAEILFNQGAVYYRQGDYAKAADAFQEAAIKTRDTRLEAHCKYNLGNTAFGEAERQQDSDLQKALEACERSVRHYQEALELRPDMQEAAENIELVRLTMKDLLDRQKQNQEAARQQQQAQQEIQEKLEELIDRQQQALDQNQALSEQRRQQGDSAELQAQVDQLAEDQRQLRDESRELSQELTEMEAAQPSSAPQSSQDPSPLQQARQHVDQAAREQDEAGKKLTQDRPAEAQPDQAEAVRELEAARDAMKQSEQPAPGQQPQPDQEQASDSKDQGQQPEEQPSSEDTEEQDPSDETQPAVALQDDARGILQEEKENRERRRPQALGTYRPVDKDW